MLVKGATGALLATRQPLIQSNKAYMPHQAPKSVVFISPYDTHSATSAKANTLTRNN